jgi:hypothetical protein
MPVAFGILMIFRQNKWTGYVKKESELFHHMRFHFMNKSGTVVIEEKGKVKFLG